MLLGVLLGVCVGDEVCVGVTEGELGSTNIKYKSLPTSMYSSFSVIIGSNKLSPPLVGVGVGVDVLVGLFVGV